MRLLLRRWLRWSRLAWFGAALLPVMAIVAFADWERMRTSLLVYGWVVWPLAWVMHWGVLRAADALRATKSRPRSRRAASRDFGRAYGLGDRRGRLGRVGGERMGRPRVSRGHRMDAMRGSVARDSLSALIAMTRDGTVGPSPVSRRVCDERRDHHRRAARGVVRIVNVISPGGTEPLPYVPIVNPLDVTLIVALAAVFVWARGTLHARAHAVRMVGRRSVSARERDGVPRRAPMAGRALAAGRIARIKPLQAALTLTWTATALPLMLVARRRAIRPLWMMGAGLLAVVVVKLFALDLGSLSGFRASWHSSASACCC